MNIQEACSYFREKKADRYRDACVYIATVADRLSAAEIGDIAVAMANSGKILTLPPELAPYADVPSTGAPASLSTLLAPLLVASGGSRVPKISATGSIAGGIDTLALIPGFKSVLEEREFIEALKKAGIAHVQQSSSFCPADKVLIDVRREMHLMANPNLAAASLLSKKVAVHGTSAVFDVRVGRTGNIGPDFESVRKNVEMFQAVANSLHLHTRLVLTDNRYFPSSALGRVESLELLWQIADDVDSIGLRIDRNHLATNIVLAAEALKLSQPNSDSDFFRLLDNNIKGKRIREILALHLEAQGGSLAGLEAVFRMGAERTKIAIEIDSDGHWVPPDLEDTKNWIKKVRTENPFTAESPKDEVGLRLLVSPGEEVHRGQPVMEVRLPRNLPTDCPQWLKGSTSSVPLELVRPQVLIPSR
jgi:thymidine phosphorylase